MLRSLFCLSFFSLFLFPQLSAAVSSTDFVRQSGNTLVVGASNTPITLKGINFRNYLLITGGNPSTGTWVDFGSAYTASDSDLPFNEVTALDYWYNSESYFTNAQAMGMNVARITLNYRSFENDATPGDGTTTSYKQSGWNFIDQLISWAKLHNMYLILDMHITAPGVLQSNVGAEQFWNTTSYQTRLRNLWKAIATKYVNEPTIAGFDLLNEPSPPTYASWTNLAQNIIDDIRTVDTNHLIIVEYMNAIKDSAGNFGSWSLSSAQISVTDSNLMYDFHIYSPMTNYQSQGVWKLCGGSGNYPDSNIAETAIDGASKPCTKAYLDYTLQTVFSQAISANVPINIGEWGGEASGASIWSNSGGAHYVSDMILALSGQNANWQYYSFDGLYSGGTGTSALDTTRTTVIAQAVATPLGWKYLLFFASILIFLSFLSLRKLTFGN